MLANHAQKRQTRELLRKPEDLKSKNIAKEQDVAKDIAKSKKHCGSASQELQF